MHSDFPLKNEVVSLYISNRALYAIMWGFGGSMTLSDREQYSNWVKTLATTPLPNTQNMALLDYEVDLESGNWVPWKNKVPTIEIETHKVSR